MKINAKITLLFSKDGMTLEIHDNDSNITFVKLKLNTAQACRALSRLSWCDVQEAEVFGLDKIGKVHENKELVFEVPFSGWEARKTEDPYPYALKACPDGWIPDNYFNSRDSFFDKGGKHYARCIIRRWVAKG